ncbi:MAG: SDR family oxidoreductase [Acidobacteriia bacterium]|jgi:3-oxoacyl-[acyl-carrier protein] reductase|nr:SDR family oxidoreductase [Terriglobia bacterium]
MDLGLNGKVAIVAAASQGLGRAVAFELAREGARVAICARNADRLQKAAEEISQATGSEVLAQALDVTDYIRVQQFVAAVEQRFGRVDICVTNAGGPPAKTFLDISIEEWRRAVELTLMSTVYFAREVLPRMQRQRWGRLITITSMSVKQPIDGLLLSNSIRAAVTGLARTLANEFGPYNITVNNVCPGYTLTERLYELADRMASQLGTGREQVFERWKAQVPLGRLAQPEEFAALVAFLCSERAGYINGTTIAVDGGWVRSLL